MKIFAIKYIFNMVLINESANHQYAAGSARQLYPYRKRLAIWIGHFRVALYLFFKGSLGAGSLSYGNEFSFTCK